MKSIELVRWALNMSGQSVEETVAPLRDHPLTPPTSAGGNHAIWLLGHLAWSEADLRRILLGEDNPLAHWQPLFGTGSQPIADLAAYPSFDEVLAAFRTQRAATLQLLETLDDNALDQKPVAPLEGFEECMSTFAHTLLLGALHQMVHYGQIADVRRAVGIAPPI